MVFNNLAHGENDFGQNDLRQNDIEQNDPRQNYIMQNDWIKWPKKKLHWAKWLRENDETNWLSIFLTLNKSE